MVHLPLLKQDAIRLGMRTLRQAAILKLKEGTTTVDEVMRVSARIRYGGRYQRNWGAVTRDSHLAQAMMQYGASDLHLSSGSPPQLRVDGRLRQLRADILRPADTKRLCMSILTKQRRDFEDKNDMDVSFWVSSLGSANIFRQRGAIAGSFRKILMKSQDQRAWCSRRLCAPGFKAKWIGLGHRAHWCWEVHDTGSGDR